MANASFTSFRDGLLNADIDLLVATIKVALVRSYTFDASHQFMSQVTGAGGVINGSIALAGRSVVNGVFDAADAVVATTVSNVAHGAIVYQSSAVGGGGDVAASAQRLCWYFDTGTNFPINPGSGIVTIIWPDAADKIYKVG